MLSHVSENDFWESPHGVVANVLDCNIVVSRFEFQLCYYIQFRFNTFGKSMNFVISTSYRLNCTTAVLSQRCLDIK